MSASSRRREYCRRYLGGHPTLEAFRAWQRKTLDSWIRDRFTPEQQTIMRLNASDQWAGGEPMVYPTPPDDSP